MSRLVGYGFSQVPTNGMLGGMAYQDPINVTATNITVSGGTLNVGVGGTIITTTGIGSVGIGTAIPSQKLEVVGGEIKAGRVDSGNEGGQVSFGRSTDNATAWYIDVYGNTSTPSMRFVDATSSTVRATIDGSGRLMVGVTTTQCAVSTLKSVDTNSIGHFQPFAFYKGGLGQNPTNVNIIAVTLPNSIGISVTIMLNVRLTAYQNTDQGGERSATYCINLLRISANGGSGSNAVQSNVAQIGSDITTSVGAYSVGSLTVSVDAGSTSTGSVTAYIRISGTSTLNASDTRVYMSGYAIGTQANQPTIAAA